MKSQIIVHPDEVSRVWIDRMADAGITTMGIHPPGGADAPKTLAQLVEMLKTPEFRGLLDYAAGRGLYVEYEIHAAGYLLPRELFSTHPEYFRMNDKGERVPDWNFCVSDPDALALFARRAAVLASQLYLSSRNYYFWMDDGWDTHCRCPKCRKYTSADQQLIAINAMLTEIRKKVPDAKMAYLAYLDCFDIPAAVKPVDGVFLEYAPFVKYQAPTPEMEKRLARERAMLGPLMDFFGREDAKVLEYWYDNSLFSRYKKPPQKFTLKEEAMRKDIAQYRELGFTYISTFGCYLGPDYEKLYGSPDIRPFAECF